MRPPNEHKLIFFLEKILFLTIFLSLLSTSIWGVQARSYTVSLPFIGGQSPFPYICRELTLLSIGLLGLCQLLRLVFVTYHFACTKEWLYVGIGMFILGIFIYSFFY